MSYLLNVVYLAVLALASPWLIYASLRHGKYRQGWMAKLWGVVPARHSEGPCIWFHAVSVGEVNLIRPLLQRLGQVLPEATCVISTTTKTGFQLACQRYPDRQVFYCPLDFSWAVRRALRRVRPDLLVLVELELWPNLIAAAAAARIPVAIVNGRLSDKSFRGYSRLRGWLSTTLRRVTRIAAQNPTYAERFRDLGAAEQAVCITGSMKFDGVETDRDNAHTDRLRRLAGIGSRDAVFLAGSTQDPEERLALESFRALSPDWPQLRLIIVPRHPERFEDVARMLSQSGLPWQRRSALTTDSDARILLVDTIGELAAWWGVADVAFVGGSLGSRGGQNMIEPAAYGAVVAFGPQTANFRDIVEQLRARDAGVVVRDGNELTQMVQRALADPLWAGQLGRRAQQVVLEQQGAVEKTTQLLQEMLPRPQRARRAS